MTRQRAFDESADANPKAQPRRTATGRKHSPTRERLLREIERRGSASTAELVEATGLHENTVRGHLERLHSDGHLRREESSTGARGRPAVRWRTVDAQVASPYAGLAATLAETLERTVPDAVREARRTGTTWGARLAAERQDDKEETTRSRVLEVMREQGFAPVEENSDASATATIALRVCPLLAAAAEYSEVICAVHEGMIEGIARSQDPTASAELEPFAPGGVCVLRLHSQLQSAS
ncbi:helix-turn-helix transcriptional regulator [Gulosibacter chungangensis]|uniref:Transcriptional regulator n=1 Tax=Gulosibacter chungangensis TaxID=979746 RepID=A0A7J5BGY0_9MICO|nr:winged helix-turn-helix transcriptional regulator [Gulosibacter chungangensis]KAB1645182.1 transcriptional regulator [Gulosibacter chungangensis]